MSAANSTDVYLPNPYTQLAWMPPDLASKVAIQHYTAVGSLAVLLWDIILHAPQDYKLLTRFRINIWFVIYCISRSSTLVYILGIVLLETAQIGNCKYIHDISVLYPLTMPVTTLPLVMRVCALCNNNKYLVAFFTFSWLSVLASFIIVPFGVAGKQVGNTKYCYEVKSETAAMASAVSILVLDILIFVVTSAVLKSSYGDVSIRKGYKAMLLGKHLPAFFRSILCSGQAYFLAALILHFGYAISYILYYVEGISVTPCSVGLPSLVLMNNMSSHIYRDMRFGFYTTRSSVVNRALEGSFIEMDSQNPGDNTATWRRLRGLRGVAMLPT